MAYRLRLVFFFLSFFSIHAQTTNNTGELREIAFSELISELTNGKDSIFSLKNAIVKFDKEKSERYSLYEYRFKGKKYPTDTIHIYKTINFDNVHFDKNLTVYNYAFINFHFYKPIKFKNTSDVIFFNCQFDSSISRSSDNTYLSNDNLFWVQNCTFNSKVDVNDLGDNEQLNLIIDSNTFNVLETDNYTETFVEPLLRISIADGASLGFINNIINYNNATFSIITSNSSEVYFQKNKIQSKFWNYLYLDNSDKLSFINNTIESDLLFGIDKLKTEYGMQWPITEHKLIPVNYIIYNQEKIRNTNNKTFDSLYINSRVSDDSYYKYELTHLSKFYTYFKEFYNRQSANDVYIKIKHLETGRLKYLYEHDKSFTNYFEMIVNRFLERFSDYGTSPSKIVISSFKIILLFAFLFLFSTNSWNKIKLNRYNKGIEQSINYFTSNTTILKAYEIDENKIFQNTNTKAALINNRNNVPKVFSFFSLLFINTQTKLIEIKLSFWNYLNVVKNTWYDLSSYKRMFYSFLIGVIILGYLLIKVLSILFNALTLSINSFTTLGFGEIPIKGIGRYLAIIEGFIG
ncbi:hypothetical protein [Winogradskyella sp. PC D3.3]